jgi:hypothetical protein
VVGVAFVALAGAVAVPHVAALAATAGGHGDGVAQAHRVDIRSIVSTPPSQVAAITRPVLTPDPGRVATARVSRRGAPPNRTVAVPGTAGRLQLGGSIAGPFIGISNEDQIPIQGGHRIEPPDTQLAAGPSAEIEFVNSAFLILDRSGNHLAVGTIEQFFLFPQLAQPGQVGADPRVYYDASSGRFFATEMGFSRDASGNPATGTVLVAVSNTSNPMDPWLVYGGPPGFYRKTGAFCDQPVLGISADKVAFACNEFVAQNGATVFTDDFFYVLNKSQMLAGANVFFHFEFRPTWASVTPVLTTTHDGSMPSAMVAVYNRDVFNVAQVGVLAMTGVPGVSTVTLAPEIDLNITATSPPPSAPQLGDAGGARKIETNDDRFLNSVWQGGKLWVGGNDACAGAACLNFVQLDTTTWDPGVSGAPTVAQDFTVGGASGFHLYYPSVTVNPGGDLYTVFSQSSATTPVSVGAIDIPQCGANTGQVQSFPFIQGFGTYVDTLPITATSPGTRWGDYSGAAIDPADPNKVWLSGEYSASASAGLTREWGTATAQLPVSTAVDSGRPYTGGSDAVGVGSGATDWFFAEGFTGPNFDEFLTVQNPGVAQTMCVDYLLQGGAVISRSYDLPGASRTTLRVNDEVGPGQNVSMHVHAANPIVAERPMYFLFNGSISGGHDVMGATSLGNTFYFGEGSTLAGFFEFLTLMNVDASATSSVDVTYFFSDGTTKVVNHPVGPHSRVTVLVNDPAEAGTFQNVSMLVHVASGPNILAERPMYFDYRGWTGGSVVVGAGAPSLHLDLAEGFVSDTFDEWLTILNPNPATANVTITYNVTGGPPGTVTMTVPGKTRATRLVNRDLAGGTSSSVHIDSDQSLVVERPMYFNFNGQWNGGHDAVAVDSATLRSSYSFAEGFVSGSFDEFLTVENNNATAVTVNITYFLAGGGTTTEQPVTIPATSRYTRLVNDDFRGMTTAASVQVTSSGGNVLVERPMYFSFG